jgi:hypothetical protein
MCSEGFAPVSADLVGMSKEKNRHRIWYVSAALLIVGAGCLSWFAWWEYGSVPYKSVSDWVWRNSGILPVLTLSLVLICIGRLQLAGISETAGDFAKLWRGLMFAAIVSTVLLGLFVAWGTI